LNEESLNAEDEEEESEEVTKPLCDELVGITVEVLLPLVALEVAFGREDKFAGDFASGESVRSTTPSASEVNEGNKSESS